MVTDRNYNELQVGDKAILYGKFKGLSLGTITNITDLTFCDVEYNNRTIKNIPSSDLIKYEKPNKAAAEKVVERKTNEKHCPRCNQYLGTGEIPEIKYCFNCGQRIYWSDKK